MSAPLSIIIPTLDAADRLGPTLAALGDGIFDGLIREVIIADGGSQDDIAEIADGTGARFLDAPRGRGSQLAAGAEAALGDWLLFLHADSVLAPGWGDAVRAHILNGGGRAAYFRLMFDDPSIMAGVTAGWANLRSRIFALPYGDQGLLIERGLYARMGGYPALPLMEDVALVRRLGRARLTPLAATATTSAGRYRRDGWIRRGLRNLTTLTLYLAGVAPERLVRWYNKP